MKKRYIDKEIGMDSYDQLKVNLQELQEKIGYHFKDPQLLLHACCHSSYVNENKKKVEEHYERLEFLGDAILGGVVCDYLYMHYPEYSEGELSQLKSLLVDASACLTYVEKLEIDHFLLLGKGEKQNHERSRQRLLANFFESITGAMYLDGGFNSVKTFFHKNCSSFIADLKKESTMNYKAKLQELTQHVYHEKPIYLLVDQSGPDHEKIFTVEVYFQDECLGKGQGKSKKVAEQQAAKQAIEAFERKNHG